MRRITWLALWTLPLLTLTVSAGEPVSTQSSYTPPSEASVLPEPPRPSDGPTITYRKPKTAEEAQGKIQGDVRITSTYRVTIKSEDGTIPVAKIQEALEQADAITITGLTVLPLHACDDAQDCADVVDEVCLDHKAGGRDTNTSVHMEWNVSGGYGSCTGTCSNGGTVEVLCLRI